MPKAKRFSIEEIERARKFLRGLPPKSEVLQAEVIARTTPDILKALGKGYSLKEVQKILAAEGIDLHMAKLKAAVDAAKAGKMEQSAIIVGPPQRSKVNAKKENFPDAVVGAAGTTEGEISDTSRASQTENPGIAVGQAI